MNYMTKTGLIIILFIITHPFVANPKNKPVVHIKPGYVYSMKFDEKQNKTITDWLANRLNNSIKLPNKLAWTPEHRPGKYLDNMFFKSNVNSLNMRHLGTVKHIKSNRDLAVVLVLPEDNEQLKANFRPAKPFVLLLKPSGVLHGKAPSRTSADEKMRSQIAEFNKASAVKTKNTEITVLSSNFKATCIRGDCKGANSTVQFSDGTQIKGNMNPESKNANFEYIYTKGSGGASRFKGTIDYVTLKPIKGKLYYDDLDLLFSI